MVPREAGLGPGELPFVTWRDKGREPGGEQEERRQKDGPTRSAQFQGGPQTRVGVDVPIPSRKSEGSTHCLDVSWTIDGRVLLPQFVYQPLHLNRQPLAHPMCVCTCVYVAPR